MTGYSLTVEQEMAAHMLRQCRNGDAVKDACGDLWQKINGLWYGIGYPHGYSSDAIARCCPVNRMAVSDE